MRVIMMYSLNPKAWPGPYNFIPTLIFSMSAGSALFSYAATLQVILNFNSFLFLFCFAVLRPGLRQRSHGWDNTQYNNGDGTGIIIILHLS